ncbi:MAG: homocysteine S-methyltransferase family protein [Pseudomonadales bacterium]
MYQYRDNLPQLSSKIFLMDGGMETTLIFQQGIDLPEFASFDLLSVEWGEQTLRDYFVPYIEMANESNRGFILESPTWRANPDWGKKIGYSLNELEDINSQAIALMAKLRDEYQQEGSPLVISGCIGPRGDGYRADTKMSAEEARDYHSFQINVFADTAADFVSALTLNYLEEAIGIALAAKDANIPAVIAFTTETDGLLPSGMTLQAAIEAVEKATDNYPAYYKINCAHPQHFMPALKAGEPWMQRIRALRANASCKSHAELDESTQLDRGNPQELAQQYRDLRRDFPQLTVLGGCCGTDIEHVREINQAC